MRIKVQNQNCHTFKKNVIHTKLLNIICECECKYHIGKLKLSRQTDIG